MTDLIDRLSGIDESGNRVEDKINLHYFMALERLYAAGEVTASEIVNAFVPILTGDQVTQATQLKAQIDAETTREDKLAYILTAESVFMALEEGSDTIFHDGGTVDKSKVVSVLNMT